MQPNYQIRGYISIKCRPDGATGLHPHPGGDRAVLLLLLAKRTLGTETLDGSLHNITTAGASDKSKPIEHGASGIHAWTASLAHSVDIPEDNVTHHSDSGVHPL